MASCLAFLSLLLFFSFPVIVNTQSLYNSTAIAPTSWINSPAVTINASFYGGSIVRVVLLQLNPDVNSTSFAAGFYCFSPCESFYFSIFMVYADSKDIIVSKSSPEVIWSANRAHPVSDNATLQLTSQSGLTLYDSDGSLVWTTHDHVVNNQSVAGINITESGNLVLFDKDNSSIWQSWEHPTDTLIMWQPLAGGQRLIASSSSTNWTEGRLYLTVLAGGLFAFVDSDPSQLYYQFILYSNRSVDKSAYVMLGNRSLYLSSSLSNLYQTRNLVRIGFATNIRYIKLESDGHLRIYEYSYVYGLWSMVIDLFSTDNCAYPTSCGHYGICNNGQCACPGISGKYFELFDDRRPELGCSAMTPMTCEDVKNHHLLTIYNVSYFNYADDTAFSRIDEESCRKACLVNCSCKAVVYRYFEGNISDGRCFPLSEVFSFENYDPEAPYTNSSAYIKVQVTPSPTPLPSPPHRSFKVGLGKILEITFGIVLVLVVLIGIYLVFFRRGEEAQDEDYIDQFPGMPTRFCFEELQVATENFTKKLGEGGFGAVFEGSWGKETIAVKSLYNIERGKKDFLAEVETIGCIHHINLVRLIGFCADKFNRLLVYEYMSNGSLDKWIYCSEGRVPLDWPIRFKIITDIAKGLCYLHEECRQRIVHFDIKPENILLDDKFNAKVSDFGLSKLIDREKSGVMTRMRGTPGYLAPEWLTSVVTEKVDVYSFGVVVMEILCGRRNIDNSQTKENHHLIAMLEIKSKSNKLLDLIDKNIGDVELYEGEIMNVMELAMWCLQWDSNRRPSMSAVVKVLERAMEVEASLDYNFISSIPLITNAVDLADDSAPLQDSILSGPI
ncbi:Serine/threonine-protein kinase [Rhynchospora pubera]|uniref:Receptor-like serine/threonine-protein kinase n=1 Tax=Rhynchospora pubera TaxID=906938 RepID=A0AAV8C7X5_9POAL|nr:Serine/threonine-protein kinase [Rhynchospora pubera]